MEMKSQRGKDIMEENRKVREDVLKSISSLTDEQLNKQVGTGKWSIMQVLDHLYLMERGIVHKMMEAMQQEEDQPTEKKPIELTVNRSVKIDAPSFVVPSDQFISLEEMKKKLNSSRENLENFVAQTDTSKLEKRSLPHPVFGQLDLAQWIPFIGLHEKRHLEQIEEIKQELNIH